MDLLLAFLGVAVLVIVTPGPDTAMTIRATLLGGRRAGVLTATGVVTGQACWTLAASAGITALLVASEPAFLALKFAGAAYLVYLGLHSLVSAIRGRGAMLDPQTRTPEHRSGHRDGAGRAGPAAGDGAAPAVGGLSRA
jgi:threonine/homoserine/homoserine lactone efflux protein